MERSHLESLDRSELRRMVQEADLGGSWTGQAAKADFVASLLAGQRILKGCAVDRNAQPVSGADPVATLEHVIAQPRADGGEAAAAVAKAIATLVAATPQGLDVDQVTAIAKREAEAAASRFEAGGVSVYLPNRPEPVKFDGLAHKLLPEVAETVSLTRQALLVGGAGVGKTTLSEQVAKVLGLQFRFLSCTSGTSEGQLLGRLLLDGSFLGTPLLDAIENGHLCLLDEADAPDPNVMLALNAGIANGRFSIPNRPAQPVALRHPDFVLLLAGNDFTGGSALYSGRQQQDAALLDRFAGCVFPLEPDTKLERGIAKSYGEESEWLASLLRSLRANVERHQLRRVVSVRLVQSMGKLIKAKPETWAGDRARIVARVLAGWTPEEVAKALDGVDVNAL